LRKGKIILVSLIYTTFQREATPGMWLSIPFNLIVTLLMPVMSWKISYTYIYFTLSQLLLQE